MEFSSLKISTNLDLDLGSCLETTLLGSDHFFSGMLFRFEPNLWGLLREVVFLKKICPCSNVTQKKLPSTTEAQSKQVKKTCLDLCPCICLDLQRFRITMFVVFGRIHFGVEFLGRRSFEFCSFGFWILSFEFVFCFGVWFWNFGLGLRNFIFSFWMFWIFDFAVLDFRSFDLGFWILES